MNKNQDGDEFMDMQNPAPVKLETYQLMMAENILRQIGIKPKKKDLIAAVTDENSKYFLLLKLPMKICLNALIIGQINSYKLFCQKRLTDYVVLTNPSNQTQDLSEIEDKIPQDIIDQKNMLKAFQTQSRDVYQNYYDVVASIWSYLKNFVQKTNKLEAEYNLLDDPEYVNNNLEYEENLERLKFTLLNFRNQIQDQARSLIQILSEKSEFVLEPLDDEEEKLELQFYHKLGLEDSP